MTSDQRCPICDQMGVVAFAVEETPIVVCHSCRHRFAGIRPSASHVTSVYCDDYFSQGGAGYNDYLREQSIVTEHGRRYAKQIAKYAKSGKLLDVGSAAGFLMRGFEESGWQVTGLEPNQKMASEAVSRFGFATDVEPLETATLSGQFDLICMVQVIAHFYDLRQALTRAQQMTAPGGMWLVETWNFRSLTARLFGRRWHEYSPPSVLQWFSPHSLATLAAQFGMTNIAHGQPRKTISGRHARSLLKHTLERAGLRFLGPIATRLIPRKAAIPYPANDVFWMLFQKLD